MSLITLQTDFGTRDAFVAAMKAVILRIAPGTSLLDITHEVPPFDLRMPGLNWLGLFDYCLPGTIHIGVIDPGVGTEREIVLCCIREQWFIAPDNGLLTPLLETYGNPTVAYRVEPGRWTAAHPHPTFHGRDIFAPVAAHLALGEHATGAGPERDPSTLRRYSWPKPTIAPGQIAGQVLYADRFGNLWSNIRFPDLTKAGIVPNAARIVIGDREIIGISPSYGQSIDAVVAVVNSVGYIEIAVVQGNALESLGVGLDTPIMISS